MKQLLNLHPLIERLNPKGGDKFDPRPGVAAVLVDRDLDRLEIAELVDKSTKYPDAVKMRLRKDLESEAYYQMIEVAMGCIVRTFLESPTIYEIDPEFHELLMGAKWKPDIPVDYLRLPKGRGLLLDLPIGSFMTCDHEIVRDATGIFVVVAEAAHWYAEHASLALVLALAPFGFPVAVIPLVEGRSLEDAYALSMDTWLSNFVGGNRLSSIPMDDGTRRQLVKYSVNTLLYLIGEPDTVAELHPGLPQGKKHRNKPDFAKRPVEVVKVGSRIGGQIRRLQRFANQEPSGHSETPGTGQKKPTHIRSAHFHAYRVGHGRKDIIVRLLASIVVNGIDHDLADLADLAREGGVVKVL